MALRQHTQSDYDRRVMPSLPLDSMYTWTTLCMHAIIALRLHTWSDDVGCGMFECPLGSTHGRMTSSMTFHYRTREELTVERRRAWHSIVILGQHTLLDDVGRGMQSMPIENIHDHTMSGLAFHILPREAHTVGTRRS